MKSITILVEYEDSASLPAFTSGMEVLNGKITRVQFSDLFAETEEQQEQMPTDFGVVAP